MAKEKEKNIEIEENDQRETETVEVETGSEKEDQNSLNNETTEEVRTEPDEELTQSDDDKIALLEDKLLRTKAEFENYKKRTLRQYDEIRSNAEESVLRNFLDVLDNFERALEHADDNDKNNSYQEGTELIYRQMKELLQKYNVQPIDAVGEQFDPLSHEAMMQIESDDYSEGIVALEINKGYMIGDKVLRHSKVGVSKGKIESEDVNVTEEDKREDK